MANTGIPPTPMKDINILFSGLMKLVSAAFKVMAECRDLNVDMSPEMVDHPRRSPYMVTTRGGRQTLLS